MRVLVTGNTGFKGTWLGIYLSMLGHEVHGYSLDYHPEGLNYQIDSKQWLSSQTISDIRDKEQLRRTLQSVKPELVFHLAAQPIVLDSIKDPANTFDVNVNGTLNVLEVAKSTNSVQKVLVVTSDKVYDQDANNGRPSKEVDRLGGKDPYSYSKVCQDLVAQSFQELDEGPEILIARAGNVIGGFDKGKYRLVPDALESLKSKQVMKIRNPESTRPWQHVLDCVSGYIQYSLSGSSHKILNFGPKAQHGLSVLEMMNQIHSLERDFCFRVVPSAANLETPNLALDSSLAEETLGWSPVLGVQDAIQHAIMELEEHSLSERAFGSVGNHISLSNAHYY